MITLQHSTDRIARRRLHHSVFAAAGLYNIGWGIYSVLDPQWFFRFAKIVPLNHPEIFACLGMVIGLYGLLYLHVARDPENGWRIAAVGLTGKILGPIGATVLIAQHRWPLRAIALCVTNDFLWLIPFSAYLFDCWKMHRASVKAATPAR